MMKRMLIAGFIFCVISLQGFAQEGKLDKGKESLKTSSSSSSSSTTKSNSKSRRSNRNNNDSFADFFFAEFFIKLFAYTAYGVAVETPFEKDGRMHYADIANYPYQESNYGNFIYTDSTNYNITRLDITNNFVMENSNLYGNNFGVNFRFLKRFALDVDYLYLVEKVNGTKDSFSLYSALLKYYRVRTQRFDAWFGLGMMHVGSDVDETGFGIGLGAEWFIKKPISLGVSHKWTNINQQEVHKTKLLLKYHLKNYHISSGYEHFKIGVSKIDSFSVGIGASF